MKINHTATLVPTVPLADIKFGECFRRNDSKDSIFLKVFPVKSLVHSTMVHEVLTRGDCFIVSITTGSLTVAKHSEQVSPLVSSLNVNHMLIDNFKLS